jgi:16S rRNA (guanine966-N2)-methyltransferase
MRVVAGTARGRPLRAPRGLGIRPTSDRVREAIFNSLTSLDAVEDATVYDLFAGTGALGIEALSRGAAHVTFVDHDAAATRAIEENLAATGLASAGPATTIVRADVTRWLASASSHLVDLALLDPPYATDDATWAVLLDRVAATRLVLESDRELALGPRWQVVRQKRYGSTFVIVAHDAADR